MLQNLSIEERKADLEARMIAAAKATADEFYDSLTRHDPNPGSTNPLKFVLAPETHIQRFYSYLEYLEGIRSAFEIGIGAGYFFVILQELLGIRMSGCDVPIDNPVYRRMREKLGIDALEHAVTYGKDIPIPARTEAVIGTWTQFHRNWGLTEHEWFVDQCAAKLTGPRLLMLRFGLPGYENAAGVPEFYHQIGTFPMPRDKYFCVIKL
jgi:hypothetical protein